MRDQLPCRREQATSEDPFAVALMKGEMIVSHAQDLAVASSRRCTCALQLLAHSLAAWQRADGGRLRSLAWGWQPLSTLKVALQ